jgi:hypothetical protein
MSPVAGRGARKRARSERRSGRAETTTDLLRVVVAADPQTALVRSELTELTKGALLYGDRVTVLSPVTAMLLRASELGRARARQQMGVLQRTAPLLGSGLRSAPVLSSDPRTAHVQAGLAAASASLGKAPSARNTADLLLRETLLGKLGAAVQDLAAVASRALRESGLGELEAALPRECLEFADYAPSRDCELLATCLAWVLATSEGRRFEESSVKLVFDAFVTELSRHSTHDRGWYLLDEAVASLASSNWQRPAAVWGWLPTFPQATADELLDIRSRLSAPIDQLHRALRFVSESFADQPTPAGEDLHEAWRQALSPAIEAIAAAVHQDEGLQGIAPGVPGTIGPSRRGLALIGPATDGGAGVERGAGFKPVASAPLAAAWHRRPPNHQVCLPPFLLVHRQVGSVPRTGLGAALELAAV